MRKLFIFITTFFFLQSCGSGDEVQLVTAGNIYSLSIPAFLTKVNNLADGASLQYQHARKEFYVVATDELKEEMQQALVEGNLTDIYKNNIEGYSKIMLEAFKENLGNPIRNNGHNY